MTILADGATSFICRAASMPVIFGIRMSISTTSGSTSPASCTASAPSEAWPTSSMPASSLRTISRPRRKKGWSSAISTRIGSPPDTDSTSPAARAEAACGAGAGAGTVGGVERLTLPSVGFLAVDDPSVTGTPSCLLIVRGDDPPAPPAHGGGRPPYPRREDARRAGTPHAVAGVRALWLLLQALHRPQRLGCG